jgi:hypothetical protein
MKGEFIMRIQSLTPAGNSMPAFGFWSSRFDHSTVVKYRPPKGSCRPLVNIVAELKEAEAQRAIAKATQQAIEKAVNDAVKDAVKNLPKK